METGTGLTRALIAAVEVRLWSFGLGSSWDNTILVKRVCDNYTLAAISKILGRSLDVIGSRPFHSSTILHKPTVVVEQIQVMGPMCTGHNPIQESHYQMPVSSCFEVLGEQTETGCWFKGFASSIPTMDNMLAVAHIGLEM